ncbi:hypothetical protein POX_g08693 [Penicillium oxalicum]|uniref:hypothetical protein n=1 Tax=Penicillium oxalicum TaxID=69781 RepID=UPI0020B87829|nr:hypothetical protein POX_g08693 [Penicillium oxalicum]KAI2786310.1 hypothetical protein POX_g08693 [Penicillium oxalicum]
MPTSLSLKLFIGQVGQSFCASRKVNRLRLGVHLPHRSEAGESGPSVNWAELSTFEALEADLHDHSPPRTFPKSTCPSRAPYSGFGCMKGAMHDATHRPGIKVLTATSPLPSSNKVALQSHPVGCGESAASSILCP